MKYKIVTAEYSSNLIIKKKLQEILKDHSENTDNFEYLFVIGGDGTYAKAVKDHAFIKDLKIIGINGGNVGFFSSFNENNLADITQVLDDSNCYKTFHLIKLDYKNKTYYGFNDAIVFSHSLLNCDVFLDGHYLESFRGSGLLFSTKYGSTAYNKSAKGPVIFPNVHAWIMNELFPQSTNKIFTLNNPLILNLETKISLSSNASYKKATISLDGIEIDELFNDQELQLQLILSKAFLYLPCETQDYITKLRSIFLK